MGEERIELEKLTIVLFQSLMQNTRLSRLLFSISCILLYFTSAIWPTVFMQEVIWMSCYKY